MDKHNKMIGGENKETSASKKLMKEAFTKVVFESFQIEYDAEKTYIYTEPVFELLREDMEDPEEKKKTNTKANKREGSSLWRGAVLMYTSTLCGE